MSDEHRIPAYITQGKRSSTPNAFSAGRCVATCPYGSVELTLGLDAGGKDLFSAEEA